MSRAITPALLESLIQEARLSPRGRQHANLHSDYGEACQRLLNAVLPHSYIRPHRHAIDPKTETLIAVLGVFKVVTFDDMGMPLSVTVIGAAGGAEPVDAYAIEVAADEWHTAIALTERAVLLEVKAGPFNPSSPKEGALWAPDEGSPEAAPYLEMLRNA